jgi:hypothetical protein
MESIAHNPDNLASMEQFFNDAKKGTLPHFAFINPRSGINVTTGVGSNDMHPDHVSPLFISVDAGFVLNFLYLLNLPLSHEPFPTFCSSLPTLPTFGLLSVS